MGGYRAIKAKPKRGSLEPVNPGMTDVPAEKGAGEDAENAEAAERAGHQKGQQAVLRFCPGCDRDSPSVRFSVHRSGEQRGTSVDLFSVNLEFQIGELEVLQHPEEGVEIAGHPSKKGGSLESCPSDGGIEADAQAGSIGIAVDLTEIEALRGPFESDLKGVGKIEAMEVGKAGKIVAAADRDDSQDLVAAHEALKDFVDGSIPPYGHHPASRGSLAGEEGGMAGTFGHQRAFEATAVEERLDLGDP